MLFINGMVKLPVVTTLATELPLIEPIKPLAITATLAGPPVVCPARAIAMSIKNLPIPVLFSTAPKRIKRKTKEADTPKGCLLYTSDAADEEDSVDLGGRRIIKKKKKKK